MSATETLRRQFKPEEIGKLPRVTCPKCSDRNQRCDEHKKAKCRECQAYVSERHIHIDYVGHADVTSRLLEADEEWTWEPKSRDVDPAILAAAVASGNPEVVQQVLENAPPKFDLDDRGNPVGLWIRLTVGGITRPGYGSVPSGQPDAVKVLIGDALRNAAMRFGVALDLWAKGDRADPTAENATASAGQARRGRKPSAAEAFDNASPVRPAPQLPETAPPDAVTDWDWMSHLTDDLIPAAASRDELAGFWADVALHVTKGECTDENAGQVRSLITERAAELGLEMKAA